jgi:hypothetical protein
VDFQDRISGLPLSVETSELNYAFNLNLLTTLNNDDKSNNEITFFFFWALSEKVI